MKDYNFISVVRVKNCIHLCSTCCLNEMNFMCVTATLQLTRRMTRRTRTLPRYRTAHSARRTHLSESTRSTSLRISRPALAPSSPRSRPFSPVNTADMSYQRLTPSALCLFQLQRGNTGFPQGREIEEEKKGHGKVREIVFLYKVRGK